MEQREREEEEAGLSGMMKNKAVKGKRPRKIKDEVMPSPQGIRVEPKFDSIKKKAENMKKPKVSLSSLTKYYNIHLQ